MINNVHYTRYVLYGILDLSVVNLGCATLFYFFLFIQEQKKTKCIVSYLDEDKYSGLNIFSTKKTLFILSGEFHPEKYS